MNRFSKMIPMVLISVFIKTSPVQIYSENPLVHTYSIVAVDSLTGQIGAAVQSHWFSVGSRVIWAEAGVGAVATQSFTNPAFGPEGLKLLKSGLPAQQVLESLLSRDEGREFRQVGIIDVQGNSAAFTGKNCIPEAGNVTGKYYAIQANLMLKKTVWTAMETAFLTTRGPLAERLVAALEAAENEGGDIRGKQSAALLVVAAEASGEVWNDREIDLRVEDHPTPVKEMKRLLKVHRAYEHMNAGDLALEHGDEKAALEEYGAAEKLQPDNLEMKYWHAISLLNIGKTEQALPILKQVFQADSNWKLLTPRLVEPGLLEIDEQLLQKILTLE